MYAALLTVLLSLNQGNLNKGCTIIKKCEPFKTVCVKSVPKGKACFRTQLCVWKQVCEAK